jgi:hypothetical protein
MSGIHRLFAAALVAPALVFSSAAGVRADDPRAREIMENVDARDTGTGSRGSEGLRPSPGTSGKTPTA